MNETNSQSSHESVCIEMPRDNPRPALARRALFLQTVFLNRRRSVGVFLVILSILAVGVMLFLSFGHLIDGIELSPPTVDLHVGSNTDSNKPLQHQGHIFIKNSSRRSLRILGISASCSCIQLEEHAATLLPWESQRINWTVRYGRTLPNQLICVFTDHPLYPKLVQSLTVSSR